MHVKITDLMIDLITKSIINKFASAFHFQCFNFIFFFIEYKTFYLKKKKAYVKLSSNV